MQQLKMTPVERQATLALASIMGLRMVGLFMVLPVFSLYASGLAGATPLLVGLALGVYGLTQALCQIPFGSLSDHFGRKRIILLGLVLFTAGSVLAALANSIVMMIIGRALQGVGAVGSTLLALIADLTRAEQRSKAMAVAGITIGFSFALAMLLGPLLSQWFSVGALFLLAAGFSMLAIIILYTLVPTPTILVWHRESEPEWQAFFKLLKQPELMRLNIGILILHAVFTATFIILPMRLAAFAGFSANKQWLLYIPSLLVAFVISLVCIGLAERKQQLKPFFLAAIVCLGISECLFWLAPASLVSMLAALGIFFSGFSLLEAFLPSLVSRTAPAARKGTALGIYSCSQFGGIFIGGLCGGWLLGKFSYAGPFIFCMLLILVWFVLALLMQSPRSLVTQRLPLPSSCNWHDISAQLQKIPGITEISYIAEEGSIYLKMEKAVLTHADFIRFKENFGF